MSNLHDGMLLIAIALVVFLPSNSWGENSVTSLKIFYSANRHGNLEPCGCHVVTQGGVAQEAPIYLERTNGIPSIRVDAGEWIAPQTLVDPVARAIALHAHGVGSVTV